MMLGGKLILLTWTPDLKQEENTSILEDIQIWVDGPDSKPTLKLKDILLACAWEGQQLGVEYDSYGLTAKNGKMLDSALADLYNLKDVSNLVHRLRVVKSSDALVHVRIAAELAKYALDEAYKLVKARCNEGELSAFMQVTIYRGGGDYPGNEFIIDSSDNALLYRYYSRRWKLDTEDQLALEWLGVYRHYHTSMMCIISVGWVTAQHKKMHGLCLEDMAVCETALRPGNRIGEVFRYLPQ